MSSASIVPTLDNKKRPKEPPIKPFSKTAKIVIWGMFIFMVATALGVIIGEI